jgi:uncharacterized protein YecT (DUF1311 family)
LGIHLQAELCDEDGSTCFDEFQKARFPFRMGEMTRLLILTTISLLATNLPARAQHMNEKDSPCAGVVVTVELASCLSKARDVADSRLNAVYKLETPDDYMRGRTGGL